jgi:hypothetical protein
VYDSTESKNEEAHSCNDLDQVGVPSILTADLGDPRSIMTVISAKSEHFRSVTIGSRSTHAPVYEGEHEVEGSGFAREIPALSSAIAPVRVSNTVMTRMPRTRAAIQEEADVR